jgi:hypothetical protein
VPEFLLAKLKRANPSMRNRLLRYMGALAALLLTALLSGLFLLGQLKSPREETHRALTFQLEAFRTDMNSLWRSVSAMCVHLSEDMTALIEEQSPASPPSTAAWTPSSLCKRPCWSRSASMRGRRTAPVRSSC